jgi:hypothetical protein
MTVFNKKHQILESLEDLDHAQTEKVLDYIRGLLKVSRDDARYQLLKHEALKEIRQALGNGRKLNRAA